MLHFTHVIEARRRSGLTIAQAAELIDVTPRAWQHWEAATRCPSAAEWELWLIAAVALGHLLPDDPAVTEHVRPAVRAVLCRT